jgi:hypothetical protein
VAAYQVEEDEIHYIRQIVDLGRGCYLDEMQKSR